MASRESVACSKFIRRDVFFPVRVILPGCSGNSAPLLIRRHSFFCASVYVRGGLGEDSSISPQLELIRAITSMPVTLHNMLCKVQVDDRRP